MIKTIQHGELTIRAALLCITSDLPATKKLCGFTSHSASLGCSKCLKKFPSRGDKLDYSGFEPSTWIRRDLESHRSRSEAYKQAKTKAQQDLIVKDTELDIEPRNRTKVCTRITCGLYFTVTESFPELHAEG